MERRDYYEVLGVARDADANQIKRAFRKLALRYHPDRSKEPDAEERFKEIAEAYAILRDPEKRAAYDARGFSGVRGASPEDVFRDIDLSDLFGDIGFDFGSPGGGGLFDRMFGRRRSGPVGGDDVQVRLDVSLDTVAKGGTERISIAHPRQCEKCGGSGASPGTSPRACEECAGRGQSTAIREEGNVHVRTVTTCSRCQGRGHFIDSPCEDCSGHGQKFERETLSVKIPVGVREGMLLRLPGKGRPSPVPGGPPGNVFVSVHTRPDPRFERRGSHLWRVEEVAAADAVLGTSLRVPTLDGEARVAVPAGSQPGTVLRMAGKGLPSHGGGPKGDLYVALQVKLPQELSREEEKTWRELQDLERQRER